MLRKDFKMETIFTMFLELRGKADAAFRLGALKEALQDLLQENEDKYDGLGIDWVVCLYATVQEDSLLRRAKELFACLQVDDKINKCQRGRGSVEKVLDELVQKEADLQKTSKLDTPANRRKEWNRRKIIGARLKDLTDSFGTGLLLFAPASMEASKVNRWSREVARMLSHCIKQNTVLGRQIRDLSTVCSSRTEQDFLKLKGRRHIPEAIDEITTYYVGKVFRDNLDTTLDQYRHQILEIIELPCSPVTDVAVFIRWPTSSRWLGMLGRHSRRAMPL